MIIFLLYLQRTDPLLQWTCSFLHKRTWGGKWRWSFHPILPAKNLSRLMPSYVLFSQWCINFWKFWRLLCHDIPLCVDEWKNFQERVGWEEELKESEDLTEELRLWASYRGQTLARTGTMQPWLTFICNSNTWFF